MYGEHYQGSEQGACFQTCAHATFHTQAASLESARRVAAEDGAVPNVADAGAGPNIAVYKGKSMHPHGGDGQESRGRARRHR